MGFLAKLFPKWIAPREQTDLALGLEEYVQKLQASAILESGLADEMIMKFKKDGTLDGLEPMDIGLKVHAQLFLLNLICHTCMEKGLEDGDAAAGIAVHVMKEALNMEREESTALLMGYMKWFAETAAAINAAEAAGDPLPDGDDYRVYLASCAAAARLAQAIGTDDVSPTEDEVAFFTSYCVPLSAE